MPEVWLAAVLVTVALLFVVASLFKKDLRDYATRIKEQIEEKYDAPDKPGAKHVLTTVALAGVGVLLGLFLKNVLAAGLLAACAVMYQQQKLVLDARKKRALIDDQAEVALQMVAALHSTMGDLVRALEATAQSVGEPLAGEIRRTVLEYHAGRPLHDALMGLAERTKNRDIDVFVKGVILSEKYGTKTEEVVTDVANIIRDRITLREEIKNEMKGQSTVINLFLLLIPLGLVGSLVFSVDARHTLMNTVGGKGLTCFLIAMEYAAWHISRKMMGVAEDL